jgi:uncharacterized membrane protein
MDDGRKTVVPDFLQANDWRFDRFAALALTLQAIVLLLTFLDDHGLVPLHVRGLFAFLFYTYVPGLVLLRALRMHRLGGVMTTLLSVAASVIILMLSGFILNLIHTEFGGPMPFTTATMLAGQTVVFLLLLALAFVTDRRYGDDPTLDISPFLTAPAFALYSLPLVAVLATYLLNGWNFAWLQVILLLAVAAAVLAIVVTRLPSQLYPLAVACIALAVLLHTSLVSRFVVEWADVSFEYWSANKTLINGYWDMVEIGWTDSVLSISVLAPIYALLTGFDLNTIFKVCYPTLFVFVPLGIFCIARPKLGLTGALLAAFLIISGRMFFTEFLGLGRQMVAELLLISIAAILLHRSDIKTHRTVMVWLLVLGIAVSHYAIVAIAFPALVASAILFILIDRKSITRSILAKVASYIAIVVIPPALWYGNVSGSKVLDRILSNYQMILDGGGSLKIKDDFIPTLLFQGDVSLHSWSIAVTFLLSFILLIYGLLHFILSRRPLTSHDRAYLALEPRLRRHPRLKMCTHDPAVRYHLYPLYVMLCDHRVGYAADLDQDAILGPLHHGHVLLLGRVDGVLHHLLHGLSAADELSHSGMDYLDHVATDLASVYLVQFGHIYTSKYWSIRTGGRPIVDECYHRNIAV